MKNIILSVAVSLSFVAGCSKSGSECEQLFEHTLSLMPAEVKAKAQDGKADAIGKCEKMSPDARKCVLASKGVEDLMKCPRS